MLRTIVRLITLMYISVCDGTSTFTEYSPTHGLGKASNNPILWTTASKTRVRCAADCSQQAGCGGFNIRLSCATSGGCCQLTLGVTRAVDTVASTDYVYYGKNYPVPPPRDCTEAYQNGQTSSGMVDIYPDGRLPAAVYCDMATDGGGWTVLLRRMDGSENFERLWADYKSGFGDVTKEFWAGLDLMHLMTSDPAVTYKLRVDLESFLGEVSYAEYSSFVVDSEADKYRLHVGVKSGTETYDALTYHNNIPFSTPDVDNDVISYSCAATYHSGWWYKSCSDSRLTGLYGQNVADDVTSSQTYIQGIMWYWDSSKHPKMAEMKIKRTV